MVTATMKVEATITTRMVTNNVITLEIAVMVGDINVVLVEPPGEAWTVGVSIVKNLDSLGFRWYCIHEFNFVLELKFCYDQVL
jgi:hypothetical protein